MPGFRHRVRQTGPVSERVWIGVDVGGTKVLAGVVDERGQIVRAARGSTPGRRVNIRMVEDALTKLSQDGIVDLDNERRATTVSNLMVVLCGEREAQPVVNAGTLYQ